MDKDIAIKVENVSKRFILPHEKISSVKSAFINLYRRRPKGAEKQQALEDISFEVKKGEFFGIVGRNGSGKSTLLKILAGIYQPTRGKISINGKLVPFIELGVGFNPELTGRENVYLNGAMLGFSRKEIDEMYDDIVAFAELERFMDQKLKNYSSGMQVRLAFSMATRSRADVLLVDEVLAVGDADFQRKCYNYFSQLKRNKVTVVFISHDMSAVREYCDRAMLIEDSRVVSIGQTDKVAERYLRLFMDADSGSVAEPKDRWGDKTLVIDQLKIDVTNEEIKISVYMQANRDFKSPVVGIRVRDATGHEIMGSNSKLENTRLPNLAKGDSLEVVWLFGNILRDGEYVVDVALQYADGITVADWWNGAGKLIVKKSRRLPYVIDPGFKIEVLR